MTIWQKIKDVPPFIAAIIAIVAAVAGLITWITGYFATEAQLKKVKCSAYINNTMISRQLDQKIFFDEYVKINVQVVKLENNKNLSMEEQSQLQELKTKARATWDSLQEARKKAKRLLDIVQSGDVVNPDGTCKE